MVEVIRQLLRAIEHIHKKGIVHADVKLENIMIANVSLFLSFRERSSCVISDWLMSIKLVIKKNIMKLLELWSIYHHNMLKE